MKIKYKGFTIIKETDLWAVKLGLKYSITHPDDTDGELRHAKSINEAKELIDEL